MLISFNLPCNSNVSRTPRVRTQSPNLLHKPDEAHFTGGPNRERLRKEQLTQIRTKAGALVQAAQSGKKCYTGDEATGATYDLKYFQGRYCQPNSTKLKKDADLLEQFGKDLGKLKAEVAFLSSIKTADAPPMIDPWEARANKPLHGEDIGNYIGI